MGIINIRMRGSFAPRPEQMFRAQTSGHAMATHEAIAWLTDVVLPDAEKADRNLRSEGLMPDDNFKAFDERYPKVEQEPRKDGEGCGTRS